MKLNGGVIGRDNSPTSAKASGVWGIGEASVALLNYSFPSRNRGWTLSNILPQVEFLSNTGVLITTETAPHSISFKPDGSAMYMIGQITDNVYQFTLSTPWDTSTISFSNIYFNVASEELSPSGLAFKPDGSSMYVCGTTGDDVNEYLLSESWNVASASYVTRFSVSAQDTAPEEVVFKPDGSRMYVVGGVGDDINEYLLSESWNVASASYVSNFSVSAQDTSPTGVAFKPDGKTMVVVGGQNDALYSYSLANAWSVESASYEGFLSLTLYETVPEGVEFSSEGDKIYVIGNTGDDVNEFYLPDPWNILKGSTNKTFDVISEAPTPLGLYFKPDGSKMYVLDNSLNNVHQYSLSSAWEVTSASYDSKNFYTYSADFVNVQGVTFNDDGTKMYVAGYGSSGTSFLNKIKQYSLSTPWDVSTASFVTEGADRSSTIYGYTDIFIDPNGVNVYLSQLRGVIRHYRMSTPWDISTSTLVTELATPIQTNIQGLYFDSSGYILFTVGTTEDTVQQIRLKEPWDISTMVYEGVSFSTVPIGEAGPNSIAFSSDGSKLYILGTGVEKVFQFDLN